MVVFASVWIAVLLVLLTLAGRAALRTLGCLVEGMVAINTTIQELSDPAGQAFRSELDTLTRTVEGLPRIWETQKRQADNAEARARYHAKHALDALEEHGFSATAGLQAVDGELFKPDDDGIEPVPAVSSSVEVEPEADDWEAQVRRKKYG